MEMLTPKYTVEVLTPQDFVWFVDVAATRMLTDELKRPELLNTSRISALTNSSMEQGLVWVVKADGECVGATAALLLPNLFNPNINTLVEVVWYVLPEYRETRAGALLLKALIEAGDKLADETTLSLLPSSEINFSSMEKRGFNLEEYSFRKRNR